LSASSGNSAMPSLVAESPSAESEEEPQFIRHYRSVVRRKKLKYPMVPEDQMQELMAFYGPENIVGRVSSDAAERRHAARSIYRRFVRWNPNFFDHFELNSNTRKWEPKLGENAEIARRSKITRYTYSMIPQDEMKRIMDIYGSETLQKREQNDGGALTSNSIYRRFSRWNPSFFDFFELDPDTGMWSPTNGEAAEKRRREKLRQYLGPAGRRKRKRLNANCST
jgi:hypothetical protein